MEYLSEAMRDYQKEEEIKKESNTNKEALKDFVVRSDKLQNALGELSKRDAELEVLYQQTQKGKADPKSEVK